MKVELDQTIAQFLGIKEFPFYINGSRGGKHIYKEESDGSWEKIERNSKGQAIKRIKSNGNVTEFEYYGGEVVYQTLNGQVVFDNRPTKEVTLEDIARKFKVSVDKLKIVEKSPEQNEH